MGDNPELRRILEGLQAGERTLDETLQRLRLFQIAQVGEFARLDTNRDLRKGVPEVLYAPGKTDDELESIVRRYLDERGYALVTRLHPERAVSLRAALQEAKNDEGAAGRRVSYQANARVFVAYSPEYRLPPECGRVGLLTAGTSDIPVAEEAALVMVHMGCRVERGYDTGVAGLHRLAEPLTRMVETGAAVLVVVAGMEGALASVVAGLVDIPVIGVPVSTGYGLGGDGTAALYSMLQSCSPGLVTVNIDNGVGAGVAAALIARGTATGRGPCPGRSQ
ncbi:MAG: nickel pincer cofactor biosynthesis protein LarB [Actinobacteria bacterium]|nr:nickel pincer cofactor biosynthesis protein LarB [Actinomycetota bacterium]